MDSEAPQFFVSVVGLLFYDFTLQELLLGTVAGAFVLLGNILFNIAMIKGQMGRVRALFET